MRTLVLFAITAVAMASSVPPLPTFPSSYRVEGRFSLIPVGTPNMEFKNLTIYYDAAHGGRQDYDDSEHIIIQSIADQFTYELIIYQNAVVCVPQNNSGPSLTQNTHLHMMAPGRANAMSIQSAFPDMTGFVYKGEVFCPHSAVQVVCNQFEKTEVIFNKTNVYEFYTYKSSGLPYLYEWQGFNELFGSHFDHYRFFYDIYQPNYSNPASLKRPVICQTNTAERDELPSEKTKNTIFHKIHNIIPSSVHAFFRRHIAAFNKQYKDQQEYNARLLNFADSNQFVNEHNANPDKTFTVELNHLADHHEWELRMMTGLVSTKHNNAMSIHTATNGRIPESIDWRQRNAVTPVKDQGFCGSCWSFSTTEALESAYFLKTGVMKQLSQQFLVDCAWNAGMGCDGGDQGPAYDYIRMNGGIPEQISYGPYKMINEICRNVSGSRVQVTGYVNITANDENALKHALATVGPIAVSIDASQRAFSFYKSGVFYAPQCSSVNLDHAVLAVGYGTENGQDYWWVKNSWSTYWGDGGYIKMARNRDNNCGIATAALYPIAA